jgi:ankyrin repeat protein
LNVFDKNQKDKLLQYLNQKDFLKRTALMIAAEYGNIEIVQELLNVFKTNQKDMPQFIEYLNQQDGRENTALMCAFEYGYTTVTVVKELLKEFENINQKDILIDYLNKKNIHGETALILAVKRKNSTENIKEMLKIFDETKKDKLIEYLNKKNERGETALIVAAQYYNNVENLQELLKVFSDDNQKNKLMEYLNKKNKSGEIALTSAVYWNRIENVKQLLIIVGKNQTQKLLIYCQKITENLHKTKNNGDANIIAKARDFISIISFLCIIKEQKQINKNNSWKDISPYLRNIISLYILGTDHIDIIEKLF